MSFLAFFAVFFGFITISSLYLARRAFFMFPSVRKWKITAFFLSLALLILVPSLGLRFTRSQGSSLPNHHIFEWIGYSALGFFILLLSCVVCADALYLGRKLWFRLSPGPKTKTASYPVSKTASSAVQLLGRRNFFHVCAVFCAAVLSGVAFYNARRTPHVKKVLFPIKNLHPDLASLKIVQLSDVHIGQTIGIDYVQKVIDRVNALQPDLVVITGDLVEGFTGDIGHQVDTIAKLQSRFGTYFVTGNHEYYWGGEEWLAYLKQLGCHCLVNEHRVIQLNGAKIVIGGVTDYSAERFAASQKSRPDLSVINAPLDANLKILLAHQPKSVFAAEALGYYDIQLSGHTHGGQLWPGSWLVRFFQPFAAGLHQYRSLALYISRGTGYWGPPARLGADSEITEIEFQKV